MPAPVLTYSPSDVILEVCGYRIGGMMSVTFQWQSEPFKLVRGIRGQNTRVRNPDSSAIIAVELLQTAVSNEVLFELLRQDIAFGTGRLQVALKDSGGHLHLQSSQGFVSKHPNYEFSTDFTPRVWEITLLNVEAQEGGGNNSTLSDIFSSVGKKAASFAERILT